MTKVDSTKLQLLTLEAANEEGKARLSPSIIAAIHPGVSQSQNFPRSV